MKNIITDNFITPKYNKKGIFLRQINSFKCRTRSIKKNEIHILKNYWSCFGLSFSKKYIDLNNVFTKKLPIILEIGFGNGKNLFYNAIHHHEEYNILGIEVYIPGVTKLIKKICFSESKIYNIKIIAHDAIEVLRFMIPDNKIHIIQLFFPDPWPKTCHHKRRIFQNSFVILITKKLIYNGILHVITDCISYAKYILNIMSQLKYFINLSSFFDSSMLTYIIRNTKFGAKAALNKKKIFNFIFQFKK